MRTFNGEGGSFQQIGLKQPPICGGTKPTLILASQYTKLILRRIRTFHVKDKAVKHIGGKKPRRTFSSFLFRRFYRSLCRAIFRLQIRLPRSPYCAVGTGWSMAGLSGFPCSMTEVVGSSSSLGSTVLTWQGTDVLGPDCHVGPREARSSL